MVLADMEWYVVSKQERHITQIAALRVDATWQICESFYVLIRPEGAVQFDRDHMAFTGYDEQAFRQGVSEWEALDSFAKWLGEEELCFWHKSSKKTLGKAWERLFSVPWSGPILCANMPVFVSLYGNNPQFANPYAIAESLGLPTASPKHCSKNDVMVLRELLAGVHLSEQALRKKPKKSQERLRKRNAKRLAESLFTYFYTKSSSVFHTKDCPRILSAYSLLGSIHYETATRTRRPCKVCCPAPPPEKKAAPPTKDKQMQKGENQDTLVKTRLLTGEWVFLRPQKIVGVCHNVIHPGKMTRQIMEDHDCLGKQCPFFEKWETGTYWRAQAEKEKAKKKAKLARQQEKEKKTRKEEETQCLKSEWQALATECGYTMEIIRVEQVTEGKEYKIFYVSENAFADGNRFPLFLEKVKASRPRCRIWLRHIRDVDGHFVTCEEFHARRK